MKLANRQELRQSQPPQDENTAGGSTSKDDAGTAVEPALQTQRTPGAPAEAAPQTSDPAGEEDDDSDCPAG